MKIRVTLTEDMLGTACADPDVHKKWIAMNSGDEAKALEEIEALPADKREELAITVFHRTPGGDPMLFDYQFKGFLKEAVNILCETHAAKPVAVGKSKITKFTAKRIVDNYVFVRPRKIRLCALADMGPICTRPLRAETMQGPRVCLASSETVKAGTSFEIEVVLFFPGLEPVIAEAMDYGAFKGLGGWRNSGKGVFSYEVLDAGFKWAPPL